jgi:hypothetical protein
MPAALSPAVNAGDPAFVAPPATDQRGAARTVGVIDIGAVEVTAVSDDDYSTAEDTPLVVAAPGVLDNDIVSAAPAVVTQPTHGTVAVAADGSFVYTPAANYNGPDSFTYSVTGAPTPATVSITVTPVDDLPVGVADSGTVGSGKSITINVLTNDFDPDGSPLTISGVTQGAKGTVVIDGGNVIYTAKASAAGTDTFTYTITDGVNSLTVTVTVSITPGQIPATGGEELPIFLTGLALVVAGSSLTSVSRRRPREVAAGS